MSDTMFRLSIILVAAIFTLVFCIVVMPPLIANPDIIGALAAGFVNPYSSGYSADVIACWFILAAWVWYEASQYSVRGGWICLLLGLFPGVAVGFALYLVIRVKQLQLTSL